MRMYHPANIRTQLVNQQVHADFAGNVAPSLEPSALQVHNDQVRGLHRALAHGGGRYQYAVLVQANRQIPIHSRHETTPVHQFSQVDNFGSRFSFVSHRVKWESRVFFWWGSPEIADSN